MDQGRPQDTLEVLHVTSATWLASGSMWLQVAGADGPVGHVIRRADCTYRHYTTNDDDADISDRERSYRELVVASYLAIQRQNASDAAQESISQVRTRALDMAHTRLATIGGHASCILVDDHGGPHQDANGYQFHV